MDRATWNLLIEEGPLNFFKGRTLHAYVYLRWMKQYVSIAREYVIPHLPGFMKLWLQNRYHCKVITQQEAEELVTCDVPIGLHDLSDQIIPYPMIRDLVVKMPHDIAVIECACRAAAGNGCKPSKVCMIIGQPFVDFVLDKQPGAQRLTNAEAVQLLREQHELGRVHSAWFKDATMGRFYAICNCCECCCTGVKAMNDWSTNAVAPSGFLAIHDHDGCNGCGTCADLCIYDAIRLQDGISVVDEARCMGCGVCVSHCDTQSLRLTLPPDPKVIPLNVRLLVEALKLRLGKRPDLDAVAQIAPKLGLPPDEVAELLESIIRVEG